ncbi:hypothetical protein MMC16_001915 [Acarospora aff. strigata]|nr:hypothetical protein [Acarospora aff. strigata]
MLFLRRWLLLYLVLIFCTLIYFLPRWSSLSSWFPLAISTRPRIFQPKYAYATFLSQHAPSSAHPGFSLDQDRDPYFTSVRLLTYQLLHSRLTRTRLEPPIPFLVLALPDVPASQLSILASEGATIIPIQTLTLPATFNQSSSVSRSRFRDVLAKLRLWQLTSYDKILALDADTILLSRLDDIFSDPVLSTPMLTLPDKGSEEKSGSRVVETEAPPPPLPSTYLLSASADTWGNQVDWTLPGQPAYLCACFMLLAPSDAVFAYYEWILARPEASFTAAYPDQDLLIYAHRQEGRMPWRRVPIEWSANDGERVHELAEGGVKSLHVKGWRGADGGNAGGAKVGRLWNGLVEEMEDYS